MLLCDHIIFWMWHNTLPGFENRFEMLMYELRVVHGEIADRFAAEIKQILIEAIIRIANVLKTTSDGLP